MRVVACVARGIPALVLACPFAACAQAVSASAAASAPSFGNLPLQRDGAGGGAMDWAAQLALALLLLAIGVMVYRWRRTRAPMGSGGALRSASALRLTPAASLHVVHWGGDELLLACTGSAVTLLARHPLGESAAPAIPVAPTLPAAQEAP